VTAIATGTLRISQKFAPANSVMRFCWYPLCNRLRARADSRTTAPQLFLQGPFGHASRPVATPAIVGEQILLLKNPKD
jgi:hypothetical protein